MKKFKKQLITAGVLTVLAVIGTIMDARKVQAQGPSDGLSVKIVNPLPVPVTGSFSINGNSAANPLLVRSIDSPGRQPFESSATLTVNSSNQVIYTFPAVPAGKRLVVEFLSAEAFAFSGTPTAAVAHFAVFDGNSHVFHLPATQTATSRFQGTGQVRAYIDGGQKISMIFSYNPGGSPSLSGGAFLSGYLVDCTGANTCAPTLP